MRISSQDVRLAARSFYRHRGFSLVAVLSLALAIALNTTMYSVIDALVRPKLDMRSPDQLYWLRIWGDIRGRVDGATRASMLSSGFHTYEGVSYYAQQFGDGVAVEYRTTLHARHARYSCAQFLLPPRRSSARGSRVHRCRRVAAGERPVI